MRSKLTKTLLVLTAVVLVGLPATGWAQQTTGTLGGTVTDDTGALIPGADVTVTSESTGVARATITSDTGTFLVPSLAPGNYELRVEMPGFSTYVQTGYIIQSAIDSRQSIRLQVGQVTEEVTVTGGSVMVDTVGSEQRLGLGELQIDVLPNPNRNITNLLSLNPAVTVTQGRTQRGARLNGLGRNAASYSMDGIEASGNTEGNIISQYQGRNNIDLISTEGIVEVQIIKGIVPAEVGNTVSGQVNIISKSGTQEFHGTAFHLYQSGSLNARDPFVTGPNPKQVYNQFGASAGFPLLPEGGFGLFDSAFGFFAYEGYREIIGRQKSQDIPTPFAKTMMATGLGNYDARHQGMMAALMEPLPDPNIASTFEGCTPCANGTYDASITFADLPIGGRYETVRTEAANDDTMLFKSDVHFTDGSHIAFTYNRLDPDFNYARITPQNDRVWHDGSARYAVSFDRSSASWILETRAGLTKLIQERPGTLFEKYQYYPPGHSGTMEFIGARSLAGIDVRGPGTFDGLGGETWNADSNTWSIDQKIGYISGNHHIKFGGSYRYKGGNRANPEMAYYRFANFTELMLNKIIRVNYTWGEPQHNARTFTFGGFIQDDWKISSTFTLNIGLRYDYVSNMQATRRHDTGTREVVYLNLEAPTDWPTFNFGRPLLDMPFQHDPINFSPRIGFNWNPDGEGKTVIRGGFGMMSAATTIGVLRDPVQDGLFLPRRLIFSGSDLTVGGKGYGFTFADQNADSAPVVKSRSMNPFNPMPFTTIEPTLEAAYSMTWSVGMQRELMQDTLLEVDIVSMRSVHFPMFRTPNPSSRTTGVRPNANLGGIAWYVDGSQQGWYNGLQMSLRKRFTRNLAYGASYAFGRSLSVGGADLGTRFGSDNSPCCQEFFNYRLARGRVSGDVEHNFSTNLYYLLPGPTSGVEQLVLGGWSLSGIFRAQTGTPQTITQRGSMQVRFPDIVDGKDIRKDVVNKNPPLSANGRGYQYLNADAFVEVPMLDCTGLSAQCGSNIPIRPGNSNRALVSKPSYWGADISLAKDFNLDEDRRIQFRVDLMNAFNHMNLGSPRGNFSGSRFGAIEGTGSNMRVTQVNLKLYF